MSIYINDTRVQLHIYVLLLDLDLDLGDYVPGSIIGVNTYSKATSSN